MVGRASTRPSRSPGAITVGMCAGDGGSSSTLLAIASVLDPRSTAPSTVGCTDSGRFIGDAEERRRLLAAPPISSFAGSRTAPAYGCHHIARSRRECGIENADLPKRPTRHAVPPASRYSLCGGHGRGARSTRHGCHGGSEATTWLWEVSWVARCSRCCQCLGHPFRLSGGDGTRSPCGSAPDQFVDDLSDLARCRRWSRCLRVAITATSRIRSVGRCGWCRRPGVWRSVHTANR